MFNQRALWKSTILSTAALLLALSLSGCSGSGNDSSSPSPSASVSSSPDASPSASPSASASPSSSASASPSAAPSASPSDPANGGGTPSAVPIDTQKPAAVSMGSVTALRLADDKIGWTGGEGWIARTDDGGKTWKPQFSGSSFTVKQIFALNADKVWATLDTGSANSLKLIRSTDGGKHWNAVGTVPNAAFLHFTSDTTAFSGNAMTTDGGKTWKKLTAPKNAVGDVYFHDASNGWAVQSADGEYRFLHTANQGKTWTTVMKRASENQPNGAIIRSTGKNDAWIELIGDAGMSQNSYALFHTTDGGKTWLPAIVKITAGAGAPPGFSMDDTGKYPSGTGAAPGTLYVVNPQIAFMGGFCGACDNPNSIQVTADGGKTWAQSKEEFTGYQGQFIAATDAKHVWMVTSDTTNPSAVYTSADGGKSWKKVHTFDKPKNSQ